MDLREEVQQLLEDWFEAERRLAHEFSSDPCTAIVALHGEAVERAKRLDMVPPPKPEYEFEMYEEWRD